MILPIKRLIVLFLILLFVSGFSTKPADYFGKVQIDGYYSIVGRFPISEEKAEKTDCYHFVYDDHRRIIKAEYFEKGKILNDSKFGVAKIVFEYSKGLEKRIFLDAENQPASNKNGVFAIHLKLNHNNQRVALLNFDKQGKPFVEYYPQECPSPQIISNLEPLSLFDFELKARFLY